MDRRLRDAVGLLTGELVSSRVSAEDTAKRQDAAAGRLERLTRWLIGFTVVLLVLTVAVVVLTVVLIARG